jgi:hypothetical protein
MTAPVASGWSGCRVGLTPTGKRRLFTAHTLSRQMVEREVHTINRQYLRIDRYHGAISVTGLLQIRKGKAAVGS